jgi:divalent metal cation (Fe/Co/Zn/Cd) transporter
VNLVAAVVALIALTVAARPADHDHDYAHGKAEYFSAGIEGMLIFVAGAFIMVTSAQRSCTRRRGRRRPRPWSVPPGSGPAAGWDQVAAGQVGHLGLRRRSVP